MSLLRQRTNAILVLEDGSVFPGRAFAGRGEVLGEVVFNTGMTGYQEVLTDPSYRGQIVAMTYPLVGNTGINPEDMESAGIHLEGFIVREYQERPSNWRADRSLKDFLEANGKIGVEGIDTRALTRRLRLDGAMKGVLTTETSDTAVLLEKVKAHPGLVGRDLVREVSCREAYLWRDGRPQELPPDLPAYARCFRVVVVDCGVKYNILRHLEARGCQVVVVPAAATGEEILAWKPDGILFSNGPGDPAALPYIVDAARLVLGRVPVFGICLGHQILALAAGARTVKLPFGHRGTNHPVQDLATGRVWITSQNHGYSVDPASLPDGIEITHVSLHDRTVEGMRFKDRPVFSVQFHPEASPGPRDALVLFDRFVEAMEARDPR